MNQPNFKKKFQCYFEKLSKSKNVQLVTFIQVDLESFLASGTFFLGREAAERVTKSQVINSSFFTLTG